MLSKYIDAKQNRRRKAKYRQKRLDMGLPAAVQLKGVSLNQEQREAIASTEADRYGEAETTLCHQAFCLARFARCPCLCRVFDYRLRHYGVYTRTGACLSGLRGACSGSPKNKTSISYKTHKTAR